MTVDGAKSWSGHGGEEKESMPVIKAPSSSP